MKRREFIKSACLAVLGVSSLGTPGGHTKAVESAVTVATGISPLKVDRALFLGAKVGLGAWSSDTVKPRNKVNPGFQLVDIDWTPLLNT
ncbi:hypothetical protein LCGC14_0390350 [marine sediment metagenome]|uniref:Uncharacterized protein n=1 Tax=marine sediment metagenome TaxID=412755 RepID=A0A0F9SZT2_9ZZZZ